MALRNVSESPARKALNREEMAAATKELLVALVAMTEVLRRCLESNLESNEEALDALELDHEEASGHLLGLAMCVAHIAATLKVFA